MKAVRAKDEHRAGSNGDCPSHESSAIWPDRFRPLRTAALRLQPAEQQPAAEFPAGDIAEVESNRPKSPEAFDVTQTEGAIVRSGSGICLAISPSNLPGRRSLASARRRAVGV